MANLDFYALADDQRKLISFLLSETDVVIYESYSEYDREIRNFRSLSEIEEVFALGTRNAALFQLWSPSVMKVPIIRRIELTRVRGHSFRYAVNGAGLIQLYLDGSRDGVIRHSHYGHWIEAGARERSIFPADDCDWRILAKLSRCIQRYIRGRLAVAILYERPILSEAIEAVRNGGGLEFRPRVFYSDSPELQVPSRRS